MNTIPKELWIDQFNFVPIDGDSENWVEKLIYDKFNETEGIEIHKLGTSAGIVFQNIGSYENRANIFALEYITFSRIFELGTYTGMKTFIVDRKIIKSILEKMFKCKINSVV